MKRVIALGMLAASLIVAPGAAFAGDSQVQTNDQYTEQNGAATDGSINTQDATSENVQKQEIKRGRRLRPRRTRKYRGYRRGRSVDQSQSSRQDTEQNGAADFDSDNAQTSTTTSDQEQTAK